VHVSAAYDYLGRRVAKTVYGSPNVVTKYAYDGDRILAEYDGSGTLLRKFIYGPGIDEPICLIEVADNNAVYYYHLDGLGSVVALSNVNRVLVERYTYDVFGRPTIRDANGTEIEDSAFGNPYRFTGRAYDAETALYYYRARYYDYATARFLQPDPTSYSDGLNLYSYCANNPVTFRDPTGLCKELGRGALDRSWRNAAITVGATVVVGGIILACPAAGLVLAEIAPYLAVGGGVAGGLMLAPAVTGYDYAGNDLSMYQRGESLSDAGFTIGGSIYGASQAYGPAAPVSPGGPTLRPDVRLSGGRAGQNVKNLTGPPNSAVRGSDGRVYFTNEKGQVVLDVTSTRAKPVTPGVGYGPKRPPTPEELDTINRLHGGS